MSPCLFYPCRDSCRITGVLCFKLKSLMVSVCSRVLFGSVSCLVQVSGTCCGSCTGYRRDLITQAVPFKTGNLQ